MLLPLRPPQRISIGKILPICIDLPPSSHRLQPRRLFTSSASLATLIPGRITRTRSSKRLDSKPLSAIKYDSSEPSVTRSFAIVTDACLSNAIPVDLRSARTLVALVHQLIEHGKAPSPRVLQTAFDEKTKIDMTWEDMTLVALAILHGFEESTVGWYILACRCQMEDENAILFAIGTSFQKRKGRVGMKVAPMEHALPLLNSRIKKMDPNYPLDKDVLAAYAMVLERDGKFDQALQYYQMAFDAPHSTPRPPLVRSMLSGVIKSPWYGVSTLLARKKDRDGAKRAMEAGAFIDDNPSAYYHLTNCFEGPDTDNRRDYLLKAAQSGHPLAVEGLGIYYIRRSRILWCRSKLGLSKPPLVHSLLSRFLPKKTLDYVLSDLVKENFRLGMEWLRIAAFRGSSRSNVYLALALRENHELEEGMRYLKMEEGNEELNEEFQVKEMIEKWYGMSDIKVRPLLLGMKAEDIEEEVGVVELS
jgi:TPR repeat protein